MPSELLFCRALPQDSHTSDCAPNESFEMTQFLLLLGLQGIGWGGLVMPGAATSWQYISSQYDLGRLHWIWRGGGGEGNANDILAKSRVRENYFGPGKEGGGWGLSCPATQWQHISSQYESK
jgi:hypothetical protein